MQAVDRLPQLRYRARVRNHVIGRLQAAFAARLSGQDGVRLVWRNSVAFDDPPALNVFTHVDYQEFGLRDR